MNEDLNIGVEVELKTQDCFLKILETLTRIGIAVEKEGIKPKLYQSCHILHKKQKYYIVHFKEMFLLDNKTSSVDELDIERRNFVVKLLSDWNLLTIKTKDFTYRKLDTSTGGLKVIPYKEKYKWNLIQKYTIGGNKNGNK